jgi:hypothetical protein
MYSFTASVLMLSCVCSTAAVPLAALAGPSTSAAATAAPVIKRSTGQAPPGLRPGHGAIAAAYGYGPGTNRPRPDYVCYNCGRQGDHYRAECPGKDAALLAALADGEGAPGGGSGAPALAAPNLYAESRLWEVKHVRSRMAITRNIELLLVSISLPAGQDGRAGAARDGRAVDRRCRGAGYCGSVGHPSHAQVSLLLSTSIVVIN